MNRHFHLRDDDGVCAEYRVDILADEGDGEDIVVEDEVAECVFHWKIGPIMASMMTYTCASLREPRDIAF